MFLALLSDENKEKFIELCSLAADADGMVVEDEKNMIYAYCREMNIKEKFPENNHTLEEILASIKKDSTEQEQKIIVFESLGLLSADDEYTAEEEAFMQKILEAFEMSKESFNQMMSLFTIYKSVYKELWKTVIF